MRSIKPGRGPSFMGGLFSLVAVGFGIIWTVMAYTMTRDSPFPMVGWVFPLFGVVFVISGLVSAAYHFFNTTSPTRMSVLDITPAQQEPDPLNARFGNPDNKATSVKERLSTLETLKRERLISDQEYDEQRRRILQHL